MLTHKNLLIISTQYFKKKLTLAVLAVDKNHAIKQPIPYYIDPLRLAETLIANR
jgi:hypothetical protein